MNQNAGTPYPDAAGDPEAANVVLNCNACHHVGHNLESQVIQLKTYPLDAAGAPILTGGKTTPLRHSTRRMAHCGARAAIIRV